MSLRKFSRRFVGIVDSKLKKTIEKVKLALVEPVSYAGLVQPSERLLCFLDTVTLDRQCGVRPNDLRTRRVFCEKGIENPGGTVSVIGEQIGETQLSPDRIERIAAPRLSLIEELLAVFQNLDRVVETSQTGVCEPKIIVGPRVEPRQLAGSP